MCALAGNKPVYLLLTIPKKGRLAAVVLDLKGAPQIICFIQDPNPALPSLAKQHTYSRSLKG